MPVQTLPSTHPTLARPSWPLAVKRGLACRCPACGEGRLFSGFLKVVPACDACGTPMHHHRADDLPPYLVIFIVGHIVGYGILTTELNYTVPMWLHLAVWPAMTLVLALAMMQPIKGAVVGLQYALGMHGFGSAARPTAGRTSRSDPTDLTEDGPLVRDDRNHARRSADQHGA